MSTPQSEARVNTYERVIYVLQEKLQEELFVTADQNLYLPAPENDAYYAVDDSLLELSRNHMVAVLIYDDSPRRFERGGARHRTSGPEGTLSNSEWNLMVSLVFRKGVYDRENPVIVAGREYRHKEAEKLRAERYSGALVDVVEKFAPKKGLITSIKAVGDRGNLIPTDKDYIGMATVQFRVEQDIILPTPSFSI